MCVKIIFVPVKKYFVRTLMYQYPKNECSHVQENTLTTERILERIFQYLTFYFGR